MTKVINFADRTETDADAEEKLNADYVLEFAKGQLREAFVIGIDLDGEVWFSGSHGRVPEIYYLLDRIKHFFLTGGFGE